MASFNWTQDHRADHAAPSRRLAQWLDGNGLTFPAEISIRPAIGPSSNRTSTQHEQTEHIRQIEDSRNPLPYPATPHVRRLDFPQPHVKHQSHRHRSDGRAGFSEHASTQHGSKFARHSDRARRWTATSNMSRSPLASHLSTRPNMLVTDEAEYTVIKPLHADSRSPVIRREDNWLVEDVSTKQLYVEKRLHMTTKSLRQRSKAERSALWQIALAGPSIHTISIFEAFYDGESDYGSLVLEYCDCGTLEDFIARYIVETKSTPEDFAWHVLCSLALAVSTCHYGIKDVSLEAPRDWTTLCHLDIQPGNVWLSSNSTTSSYPRIVLGNFSCIARPEDIESGAADSVVVQYATSRWLPPEGRPKERRGSRATLGRFTDVWQVGAVIQAMCRLIQTPDMELVEQERPCGSRYSFNLNNMVVCCMEGDWNNRPTAVDLLKESSRVRREQKRNDERLYFLEA